MAPEDSERRRPGVPGWCPELGNKETPLEYMRTELRVRRGCDFKTHFKGNIKKSRQIDPIEEALGFMVKSYPIIYEQ